MKYEDPYKDQAETLRRKIERNSFEEGTVVKRDELPPRSRVHNHKKKNKWKLKYPIIRLLVLFFILLPITIFSLYSAIAKDKMNDTGKKSAESSSGFEIINIEKNVEPAVTIPENDDKVNKLEDTKKNKSTKSKDEVNRNSNNH